MVQLEDTTPREEGRGAILKEGKTGPEAGDEAVREEEDGVQNLHRPTGMIRGASERERARDI